MKTKEIINGVEIEMKWDFLEIFDRHDSNWCEWWVTASDGKGNEYNGSTQADANNPRDFNSGIVTDIELKQ